MDLKQQGYKVLIITNGHAEIQRGKLGRLRALDLFDGVLVGGEEIAAGAAEKPAASIFLKACELVRCTPDEVMTPTHPLPCTLPAPHQHLHHGTAGPQVHGKRDSLQGHVAVVGCMISRQSADNTC